MYCYLLTVESVSQLGSRLRVLPPVPVRSLSKRAPGLMMPMAGDGLELRLPNGRVKHAVVGSFGIEAWRNEQGDIFTSSDPADPVLTLIIAGDLHPEDVPAGTEIWLSEVEYKHPAT